MRNILLSTEHAKKSRQDEQNGKGAIILAPSYKIIGTLGNGDVIRYTAACNLVGIAGKFGVESVWGSTYLTPYIIQETGKLGTESLIFL